MVRVEIWFDDLEPAAQVRLCEALGTTPDKENWDIIPIFTYVREISEGESDEEDR